MRSISGNYWEIPSFAPPNQEQITLAKKIKLYPEIIQILNKRGLNDPDEIVGFLFPKLADLPDPFQLKGMDEACDIVCKGISNKTDIVIWGDYDVDGVTSTSLLVLFLRDIGVNARYHVPNRFTEGYGLNKEYLIKLFSEKESENPILITVDCGISNIKEIEFAQKLGFTVIVTDHHEPGEILPECTIINPKQNGCSFPEKNIAGVGLSFYLCGGIRAFLSKQPSLLPKQLPNLKKYLDLVAIGTISDMVPLSKYNRILVKGGFEVLNHLPSLGLSELLRECDIKTPPINSEDISFLLGPKLNAAGRVDDPKIAVELLTEQNRDKCRKFSKKLTKLNTQRKELCNDGLETTLGLGDNEPSKGFYMEVVELSLGVLGIVASKLVNELKLPAILLTEVEDKEYGKVLKGSCRSLNNINIHKLLSKCEKHLLQFGGHKLAAGVTLEKEEYSDFKECFRNAVSEINTQNVNLQRVDLSADTDKLLSKDFMEQLSLLEPFGEGNKKLVFHERKAVLQDLKKVGKNGDHLVFSKRGKFKNHKCIAFSFADHEHLMRSTHELDIIFSISLSRYKNAVHPQLNILDLVN